MENFINHMNTYAESKGFVWVQGSPAWRNALSRFNIYSEGYKSAMPYWFFLKNVIA